MFFLKASGLTCGAVCAADYELPASKPVSAECKDILARILVVDPAKRINIKEIQASLIHTELQPWFHHGRAHDETYNE